jgi:hypothetical protein
MKTKLYSHFFRTCAQIILIFLFIPLMTNAQVEKIPDIATHLADSNSTGSNKKSAEAIQGYGQFNYWTYYSDYYIYWQWEGYNFQCECKGNRYNVYIDIGGGWIHLGEFYGASYYGFDCKYGIGPSKSGYAKTQNNETGGGGCYFLFGCTCGCSANYHSDGFNKYYYTAAIRPPKALTATQRQWDYRIDLTWDKTTDIPDGQHGYLIKRDGIEIGRTSGGTRAFSDKNIGPNETHTYSIQTIWPNSASYSNISSPVYITGTTFDLNLTASTSETNVINLNWNPLENIKGKGDVSLSKYEIDRYDQVENQSTTLPVDISATKHNYPDESSSLIPGYLYKYTLRPYPVDAFYPDTAWGKKLPNGIISGKVQSPTGQGIKNIKVCAIRQTTVPQDTTTTYCTITDTAGSYEIKEIYYYKSAQFKLLPIKEGHGFSPAQEEPTLDLNSHLKSFNFTDTSAFEVSGQVLQQGNHGLCGLEGVEIFLDNGTTAEAVTDADGWYALSVGQINTYTIKPVLEGHNFVPAYLTYQVVSDTILVPIMDTAKYILNGVVMASCDIYIGRAKLGITSGTAGNYCYDTIIMTDTLTGNYEIELPARKYEIAILEFFSENLDVENEDVETYFPVMIADLTSGDWNQDFIYRSEPELKMTGLPEYGCGAYDGIPVLKQGFEYRLDLEVDEIFGTNSCLADTGYVIIQNHVGNETEKVDTVYLVDGKGEYKFIPGDPNLISPYLKNLTLTAYVASESVTESVDVLVQGNKPREQTFTTVSPEIPFMILRDPPGDASSSYLEANTTSELAMKLSAKVSASLNAWAEVKAGAKFESGFGVMVETEIWGKVKGSLEVGASISNEDEFTLTITNGERFSTSDNPNVTGEEGDVFAGAALNIIYALTDVIKYNASTCNVEKSVALSMGADGFATTFMYTDSHIRNVIIPQLTYLRDLYEAKDNDSSKIYADQIDVWQQTLKINEDLKKEATFIENRSFSSGLSYESFQEIATKKSVSIELSVYIELGVAIEAGIEVGGSGVSGGVEVKLRTELGVAASLSQMKSKKTGFILNDDDVENDISDAFSVDILKDEVYATPVFKVKSGSSSCPWEPGTQPREGVQITSDIYTANIDDPNGTAVFHLQLANTSQSDEDRLYDLVFDQASNPDGAVITLGGSQVQGGTPTPYYVQAWKYAEATVTVRRGPDAFKYDNLRFRFLSGCDDDAIADTLLLDVNFKSPCSNISLAKPLNGWVVSSLNNNRIKVRVANYNRDLLDFVKIQVAHAGTSNWQTVSFLDKTDLDPTTTDATLLLDQYQDGEYDLRALVECSAGVLYSELVTGGKIDRRGPELFGLPEPSDLVLDSGDMIMATFNEAINGYKMSALNIEVKNLSKNQTVPAAFGCSGNVVTIIPELEGETFAGDTFNVELTGLEDMYGNVMPEVVSWAFVIKADPTPPDDADTDNDGILNNADNCPWSYNPLQEDMDLDTYGDACDDDIDGDGVLNVNDNCLMTENPLQEDINADGIGDACQDLTGLYKPQPVESFRFYENYPNPFSEKTTLTYTLPFESHVIMKVFDIVGNEVAVLISDDIMPGTWEVTWDSKGFGDGIYFCTIYAESNVTNDVAVKTIKMLKAR